jgi:elongation factor 2
MIFSHWALVSGDLTDLSSRAAEVMMAIRKRKGMKSELPSFDDFHDKI